MLLGILALIGLLVPPAQAAQAAPVLDSRFSLTVNQTTLRSGETLTARGRATIPCAWIVDWNNERSSAKGRQITATFVAPEVTSTTVIPLRANCFYTPATPLRPSPPAARDDGVGQRLVVRVPESWSQTIPITVVPSAIVDPPEPEEGGGGLPDTGGPDRWILLVGLASLLVGAALIRRASPRDRAGLS